MADSSVPPPPRPVDEPRKRKRCPHGAVQPACHKCHPCVHDPTVSKYLCCICVPKCRHGNFKSASNCDACKKLCGHGFQKRNCRVCSDCGHGRVKTECKVCSPCPIHGSPHLKGKCIPCREDQALKQSGQAPCPHGKLEKFCKVCRPCPNHPDELRGRTGYCYLCAHQIHLEKQRAESSSSSTQM